MKKEDKYFIILLGIVTLATGGVIAENVFSVLRPPLERRIDVAKVKKNIDAAGLIPHEARFWKEL